MKPEDKEALRLAVNTLACHADVNVRWAQTLVRKVYELEFSRREELLREGVEIDKDDNRVIDQLGRTLALISRLRTDTADIKDGIYALLNEAALLPG